MYIMILSAGQPSASGDPGSAVIGRGSRRGGGRVLPEQMTILRTRPTTLKTKQGLFIFIQDISTFFFQQNDGYTSPRPLFGPCR